MASYIDYSYIVLIIAIWLGDRIRRPEHSTVEHGSCDESVEYFSGTNFALITKILHTYLPFYIWSWYIYEIKVHIKYIYCYKFEAKLLAIIADNEHKLGKLGESKSIHMTVNGGGL